MELEIKKDEIFLESRLQTLVFPVNCVSVQQKGAGKILEEYFPDVYHQYAEKCRLGFVDIGIVHIFPREESHWICCFPVRIFPADRVTAENLEKGFQYLLHHALREGVLSLAFPDLTGGEVENEDELIREFARKIPIPVGVYR